MVGIRKRRSAIIGSRTRRSTTTNATRQTPPATRPIVIGPLKGREESSIIAQRIPNSPAPRSPMPQRSRVRACLSPLSLSTRSATTSAASPIGTLIQKTHRQDR